MCVNYSHPRSCSWGKAITHFSPGSAQDELELGKQHWTGEVIRVSSHSGKAADKKFSVEHHQDRHLRCSLMPTLYSKSPLVHMFTAVFSCSCDFLSFYSAELAFYQILLYSPQAFLLVLWQNHPVVVSLCCTHTKFCSCYNSYLCLMHRFKWCLLSRNPCPSNYQDISFEKELEFK